MILFQSHIALMAAGSAMVAAALLIAATQRRKPWWLRFHRGLGVFSVILILAGDAAVVAAIVVSEGSHFRTPHTWFGALTVILAVLTTLLGFMQFKIRQWADRLRFWHRLCGRILAGAVIVTILLGLRLVGLL